MTQLDSTALLAPHPLKNGPKPDLLTPTDRAELSRVGDLISRVKGMQKATTLGMAMIGFHLRAIRTKHFPSTKKGGRPNTAHNQTGYKTFTELCKTEFRISDQTFLNWITMAEAVEKKMALSGDDIATCFEKLPWDWTPEESTLIESAINAVTEGHTQKEILSWHNDFLIDLNLAGVPTKKDLHGTNNPKGKNGSDKGKPILTEEQFATAQIEGARLTFFGTAEEGKCAPESICYTLMEACKPNSSLQHLPKAELLYLLEHVIKPLGSRIKSLI